MAKKAKAPEPAGESAPMWIVSFADLVTLMMSFFVVLYAMKQDGAKSANNMAAALKATFDPNVPPIDSPSEFDQLVRHFKGQPTRENPGRGKSTEPAKGTEGTDDQVKSTTTGKEVVSGTQMVFEVGSAEISDETRATIDAIAGKLKGLNNVLMVKGHASADEVALRSDDMNGMNLSYRRACAVVEELVKRGIDRRVLRPEACGSFEPLLTGAYDKATQQANRRVEVFTTDKTASEFFPEHTIPVGEKQPVAGSQ